MNAIKDGMRPIQIIEMVGPTGYPTEPAEPPNAALCGPPLQMIEGVGPSVPYDLSLGVPAAEKKIVHDIFTRLGPDTVQQMLDEYRKTLNRAG